MSKEQSGFSKVDKQIIIGYKSKGEYFLKGRSDSKGRGGERTADEKLL